MEDIEFIKLYDIYKDLLTKKQAELFASYYLLDLSLGEIAEVEGTSRQSVSGALKIVKQKLLEYESALKIKEKDDKLSALLTLIEDKELKDKIKEIIDK